MDDWDLISSLLGIIGIVSTFIAGYLFYYIAKNDLRKLANLINERRTVSLSEAFHLTRELAKEIEFHLKKKFKADKNYLKSVVLKGHHESGLKVILAISPGGGMIAEWLSRTFIGDHDHPIPVYTIPITFAGGHVAIDQSRDLISYLKEKFELNERDTILVVNDHTRTGYTWRNALESLGVTLKADRGPHIYKIENGPEIICASIFCNKEVTGQPSNFFPNFSVIDAGAYIHFEWKSLPKEGGD